MGFVGRSIPFPFWGPRSVFWESVSLRSGQIYKFHQPKFSWNQKSLAFLGFQDGFVRSQFNSQAPLKIVTLLHLQSSMGKKITKNPAAGFYRPGRWFQKLRILLCPKSWSKLSMLTTINTDTRRYKIYSSWNIHDHIHKHFSWYPTSHIYKQNPLLYKQKTRLTKTSPIYLYNPMTFLDPQRAV